MDWIRENKTLAAIVGVAVVGAIALGAFSLEAYFGYGESFDSFQNLSGKVAKMEGAKLYPSEENVQAKEEKVSEYEDKVGSLGAVLLTLQKEVTGKPITDTDFQGKLKQRITEIRAKTTGARVPKDFAFGFDEYTRSLPRSAEATKELNDYFDGVDAIVNTTIESGVASIDLLQRSELVVEKGAPPPKPEPKKKAAAPSIKTKTKKGAKGSQSVKAPVEITKVVERRVVTLDITTDQGPLQVLINSLASPSLMKHFTVVRLLRIENQKQEGPPHAGRPVTGGGSGIVKDANGLVTPAEPEPAAGTPPPAEGAPAAAPKVEVVTAVKAAEPDAQKVLGGEMLKAHLEIDLVRFLEPEN